MTIRRRVSLIGGVGAMLAAAALVGACDEPASRTAPSPALPAVTSVEISGPASVAPGQSAQFTATARFSDGTVKVANGASVSWRTSDFRILDVDAFGVARATDMRGEVTLTAAVSARERPGVTRQSTRKVLVLPDGTYRLTGSVFDAEFPSSRIVNATVEVVPGGPATTTDSGGGYALYGVPADALLRVTRSGYKTAERAVHLVDHGIQSFPLEADAARPDLSGLYTLTIDAAGGCTGNFPAEFAHRSYIAEIAQTGLSAVVTLTEPRFPVVSGRGNRFSGRVEPGGVTFTLNPFFYYYYFFYYYLSYPSVAERLDDGTFLVVQGTAALTGSAAGLSGQLVGGLERYGQNFPSSPSAVGACRSAPIGFTLTPR